MPVTSYPTQPSAGFAGQLADFSPRYVDTAINKTGAAIPFGIALKKGTNEDETVLLAASADKLAGIAVFRQDVNTIGSSGWAAGAGIPVNDRYDILRSGVVWVTVEQAVTQGDNAFVRYVAGAGGTQPGAWRKDVDTASAVAVKGAYFMQSAGAGGLAPLYFNFAVANG